MSAITIVWGGVVVQLVCVSIQAALFVRARKIEKAANEKIQEIRQKEYQNTFDLQEARKQVFELEEKLAAIEDIQARTVLAVQKVRKGEK